MISVIVEPEVIDRSLAHIQETGGRDPFEGRGRPQREPAGTAAGVA
ncbi:MAG: hypothetical protein FJY75_14410 [Candidatus Eisenbacteria bacterium]|uniref:Uncharacterized protein n=1 Tax=Eiseniibacteriota bacterium TaxID=2212470 RepID=A0A938BSR3_UNCEI|nr:hypothetical protein [Candidatus Eisenbacteria bacterium]